MQSGAEKELHAGHRSRMLKRFREHGFDSWYGHEVLEFLLFRVLRRVNTNPLGHRLLAKFGSVGAVLEADSAQLEEVGGIGPASTAFLRNAREEMTDYIRTQMREQEEPLTVYQIALLADWFMRDAEKPVGILIRKDGRFLDFACLPLLRSKKKKILVPEIFACLETDVINCAYSLFLRDDRLLSGDDVYEIRRYNFGRSFILDEIYRMERKKPVPILHLYENMNP